MNLLESLQVSLDSIKANKFRSILTLGIVMNCCSHSCNSHWPGGNKYNSRIGEDRRQSLCWLVGAWKIPTGQGLLTDIGL